MTMTHDYMICDSCANVAVNADTSHLEAVEIEALNDLGMLVVDIDDDISTYGVCDMCDQDNFTFYGANSI